MGRAQGRLGFGASTRAAAWSIAISCSLRLVCLQFMLSDGFPYTAKLAETFVRWTIRRLKVLEGSGDELNKADSEYDIDPNVLLASATNTSTTTSYITDFGLPTLGAFKWFCFSPTNENSPQPFRCNINVYQNFWFGIGAKLHSPGTTLPCILCYNYPVLCLKLLVTVLTTSFGLSVQLQIARAAPGPCPQDVPLPPQPLPPPREFVSPPPDFDPPPQSSPPRYPSHRPTVDDKGDEETVRPTVDDEGDEEAEFTDPSG
ncbi:uncharacterized protein EDB93DRAFT_1101571 [Suillus bovinus]|uniref:uncharacterized protein n=1 Tax=Suillus bovinus TaxID=48563 RepID=UPI001B8744CF|nr:uncharacterized protein EDB93DRAFT_1101571 [Suillus bovinus]KAG2155782.1 hypothetical protein EDB93DRAFT_1101571 [Suillus bovinus]